MKVVLLKDISGVGQRGDIKTVHDGYGQNFLIPHKLAAFATKDTVLSQTQVREARKVMEEEDERALIAHILGLKEQKVVLKGKANKEGQLFGSIGVGDIVDALKIPPKTIILPEPIKKVGEHMVALEVGDKKFETAIVVEAI